MDRKDIVSWVKDRVLSLFEEDYHISYIPLDIFKNDIGEVSFRVSFTEEKRYLYLRLQCVSFGLDRAYVKFITLAGSFKDSQMSVCTRDEGWIDHLRHHVETIQREWRDR